MQIHFLVNVIFLYKCHVFMDENCFLNMLPIDEFELVKNLKSLFLFISTTFDSMYVCKNKLLGRTCTNLHVVSIHLFFI